MVTYAIDPDAPADQHMRVAQRELGQRLAALIGCPFAGAYPADQTPTDRLYLIPADTLPLAVAEWVGVAGEGDLFGGVVPHPFVATKAITHPLVDRQAAAPPGWSHDLGTALAAATLGGFSAFCRADARRAGEALLAQGPVRTKPALASAGRDQTVVTDLAGLDRVLDAMGEEAVGHGLVVEENLTDVETYSVGQVRVAGRVASYFGVQRMTTDNFGQPVYGGSDLLVAPGDFDRLLALNLPEQVHTAVSQARTYDAAAFAAFSGLFASRRNYDVIGGVDHAGRRRLGVLEQSWRMGGASSAELAALAAFRADATLREVRASSFEAYGAIELPPGADVYFHGVDDRIGPISRYATVTHHDR